jgi:hypothetical protein
LSENQEMGDFLRDWDLMDKPIRRILIVTTWRSGSTFLGETLGEWNPAKFIKQMKSQFEVD